ncbi:chemotaxis protein CheR [Desulfovibrio desulfuricans]|nr:chemotaxis protein CheR [Desulfovibrio desulfuricans]
MSQPPTLFPKSPLGSAQNSGNGSSAGSAATPVEQRPRLGVTPTPGAAPAAPVAKPVAPAPASPFRTTAPAPASPTQGAGLTGSAFRTPPAGGATSPVAPAATRPPLGQSGLGQAANGLSGAATRPPLGQTGLGQSGLGQSGLGQTARPPLGSALPPRTASPAPATGGLGAARPAQSAPATSAMRPPLTPAAAFRSPTQTADNTRAASPFRKDLQISDEEFLQLRDFIYQQCGIFIAENRKYLVENRLSNRIKELNLKSYSDYYNFLRFDGSRRTELTKLFEVVTTNETSFFRNPPQLEVFQKSVLPDILDQCRKAGRKKLRIWSAGCSTGEEPYTLAIILCEVLKSELSSWDIKITANDLSEAVLAAARRGVYNDYALRTTPKEIVDAYFIKEDTQYRVKPELKSLISFGPINLNDREQLKRVEKSQIVFCRNVIIYFDDEMKRKVINAFYDNLEINGALLIGHSESLHNISRAFQLEHHKGTIVYRKMS